jgi:hypothetical protein
MANRSSTTKWQDWATRLLAPSGLMIVMAAAVAFIVAGVYTGYTFGTGLSPAQLARDHGIAGSTIAWAVPLGLAGIAALFTGVASSLSRIRIHIRARRDALVQALPRVLNTTTN